MERVAVVGIGRIGLCWALNLDRVGYSVLGVDTNRERVEEIRTKALRTTEPGVEEALRAARDLKVEDDPARIAEFGPALVFVAVDTHVPEGAGYDGSRVDRVMADLYPLKPSRRVELALVCTTPPGFCDSRSHIAKNHGYALSYAPGFVAQGSILRDQQHPDQILIGEADETAGDALEALFRSVCLNQPSIHRMSPLSAEIAKLATNCALTMKIAFANAIGDLAMEVGADAERILAAVGADSRIGNEFMRYGFGYGGPCLPRDNRALNCFAQQHGRELLQAEATDEMNRRHLSFQLAHFLHAYAAGEPIHFQSVAYKPGTEMMEESQPLALALGLMGAGRKVVIHESRAVVEQLRERFGDSFQYSVNGE